MYRSNLFVAVFFIERALFLLLLFVFFFCICFFFRSSAVMVVGQVCGTVSYLIIPVITLMCHETKSNPLSMHRNHICNEIRTHAILFSKSSHLQIRNFCAACLSTVIVTILKKGLFFSEVMFFFSSLFSDILSGLCY